MARVKVLADISWPPAEQRADGCGPWMGRRLYCRKLSLAGSSVLRCERLKAAWAGSLMQTGSFLDELPEGLIGEKAYEENALDEQMSAASS